MVGVYMFLPQVSNFDSGQDRRIFIVITYWEIALLYPRSNHQHIVSFRVVTTIWDIFQESKSHTESFEDMWFGPLELQYAGLSIQ